jgi:hypothetical protein
VRDLGLQLFDHPRQLRRWMFFVLGKQIGASLLDRAPIAHSAADDVHTDPLAPAAGRRGNNPEQHQANDKGEGPGHHLGGDAQHHRRPPLSVSR